jgi:hypothetical protein
MRHLIGIPCAGCSAARAVEYEQRMVSLRAVCQDTEQYDRARDAIAALAQRSSLSTNEAADRIISNVATFGTPAPTDEQVARHRWPNVLAQYADHE